MTSLLVNNHGKLIGYKVQVGRLSSGGLRVAATKSDAPIDQ